MRRDRERIGQGFLMGVAGVLLLMMMMQLQDPTMSLLTVLAVWLYHPYVQYSTAQMYTHGYMTSEGRGRIAGSAAYARLGLRRRRRVISEAAKASVPLLFRMRDVALSGTGWD